MTSEPVASYPARDQYAKPLLVALLSGCGVALVLGLYAKLHHPTQYALDVGGFSSPLYAKAWLTTIAVVFAIVQLITGARIIRPGAPPWMATVHRWSGRIAILLTVPVIIHCIYALGFGTYSARVIAHSVLGCIFFVSLIALWATSALWLFATKGVHS